MLRGSVGGWLLVLLALLSARDGHALALLSSQSRACTNITCDTTPTLFGPGAATEVLRTFAFYQSSAAMTVGDFDQFSARAGASTDFSLPLFDYVAQQISMGGLATATLRDTLTATGGVGNGTVRMQWHVTGANDIGFSASDDFFTQAVEVRLGFTCAAGTISPFLNLNCADPLLSWDASGAVDELVTIDVPIIFGTPIDYFLGIDLSADVAFTTLTCSPCAPTFLGHANGDFGSTGTLVDVQLLDAAGNLLDPSGIGSESGFRYDLVGQSVPEPTALALAALGILATRAARQQPRP